VSKSRKNYWPDAENFWTIEGLNGDLNLNSATRPGSFSLISAELSTHQMPTPYRALSKETPSWCHVAFMFERQRLRSEPTDWGFVAPVWIAIGLFCTLVQVVTFQTLFTIFG